MTEIRLKIQCTEEQNHAKILRMEGMTLWQVKTFAELLCGTSAHYIHKPGPGSPIGRCGICQAPLEYSIEEREDAKA